ncbi:alpha/beta hydrolase [Planctomycetales bacterium ZRK34]|nr:alpha/beta hydrolase [Planctomycetales bacterium ZRK34]
MGVVLMGGSSAWAADAAPTKPRFKLVKPQTPQGVTLHTKLVCAQYGDREVTLDLYVPDHAKASTPMPALLFIHGGGWWKGTIEHSKPLAERLAVRGYVCALVDYRLSGEAKYPAALHDCKAALRYLRANAAKYHIDVDHIGVIGGSAGGHLSGLVGMTGDDAALEGDGGSAGVSTKVQACIVMAATMDLVSAYGEKIGKHAVAFFGGTCAEKPDVYKQASPITHVDAHDPPTLFIEAEHDTHKIGRPEMQTKLRTLGIHTDLATLPGAPHPFWMSQPWLDQTADLAAEFFDQYLK